MEPETVDQLVRIIVAVLIYQSAFFVIASLRRDNSLADVAWGGGFILVALVSAPLGAGWVARTVLVTTLITLWGGRLAAHIAVRGLGKDEDFRYAEWREKWGRWVLPRAYVQVFLLQGAVLLVIASTVILINLRSGTGLTWLDGVGGAVWLAGFVVESVADWQLHRFTSDPANRGKVMDRGLWYYSRHPNYFGEIVMWWGVWLIALSVPYGWATVLSPLLITWLLTSVSGVPMLEAKLRRSIPGYEAYAKRTSALIPWPPRPRTTEQA